MAAPSSPPANNSIPPVQNEFPSSAQWSLALILGLVLVLVCWRGWTDKTGTRPTEAQPHRADLNHASRSELQQLPGVGPNRADTLLAYRDSIGGFPNTDELRKVKGIGPKKQNQLRPWIEVSDEPVSLEEPQQLTRKPSPSRSQKPIPDKKIDINQASIADLQKLPGIGPAMSQRIVDERNRKAFEKIEDLRRVSGIGAKTLEKLRPFVTIGDLCTK